MGQITGGSVTYGRTVKTGDYENKRVDVKIDFSVADGEDAQAMIDKAGAAALTKANQILFDARAAVANTGDETPDTGTRILGTSTLAAEEAKPAGKRAAKKPPAAPAAEVVEDPAAMAEEPPVQETVADPAAMAEEDDWSAAPAEVTDKELTDRVTKKNAAIKNATAIKGLIGKYVPAPGQLREIAQDKRAAFLAELENLKAA